MSGATAYPNYLIKGYGIFEPKQGKISAEQRKHLVATVRGGIEGVCFVMDDGHSEGELYISNGVVACKRHKKDLDENWWVC